MDTKELDSRYIAGTYARFPVEIVSGKGSLVRDADGREYVDMGSGIGVTSFGIADDVWQDAIIEQTGRVQHMSNLYFLRPGAELAQMICDRSGMKKVFFSNSGAEANECAIKTARKYAADKYGEDRHVVITLNNSFHGRTITTLAATGQAHYHEAFRPLTPGFINVDAGDLDAVKRAASDKKVAAVMIECVQGEGGVVPLSAEFVKSLAAFCEAEDILLIIDEVQTGNGRTGKLYSFMNFDIKPDIFTTAKGLGGGLPIGATVFGAKTEGVLGHGDHGSTFGANPVCCAAALSIMRRIDDALLASVREKSERIFSALRGAEGVEDVSGMGLMIGIKTKKPAGDVVRECMNGGVLCLTAKDRVRLLPALNIPMELVDRAVSVIKAACK